MSSAHYALRAGAALFLTLSVHAQSDGSVCNVDPECDSNCCGFSAQSTRVCLPNGLIAPDDACASGNGCDCSSGFCINSVCIECFSNSDCESECCGVFMDQPRCLDVESTSDGEECFTPDGCDCVSTQCIEGACAAATPSELCITARGRPRCGAPRMARKNPRCECRVCPPGTNMCDDPHMVGLRGQSIDWSGVSGGWYCLVTDDNAGLHVNVRLTAPLPQEFPARQVMTGLSVLSDGHSLTIEVTNPYSVDTDGCPAGASPCLADGGLRATVDGEDVDGLLRSSRHEHVARGIALSASNLPVECRQFGGDRIWARMYDEMLQGSRELTDEETFEDWVLRFDHMAAPEWCTQYIAQHDIADLQSNHAILKIETSAVTVRLIVGTNFQGNGELDWDGRVIPDLEFWQMDVGLEGLSVESESLSGILGETARPVLDKDGKPVMKGYDAFRGTVEDYRVSGPLGSKFALLSKK